MAAEMTYDTLFESVVEAIKSGKAGKDYAAPLCRLIERSRFGIRREYSEINTFVKSTYMKSPDCRLDRHKCGACFMVAFMKKLLIEPDNAQYEKYREILTIIAGLTVLGTFIRGAGHNYDDSGVIAFLNRNNGFILPGPLCDDVDSYAKSWVLELRHAHKGDLGRFSVLSLANELFLIESYNRALALNELDRG